MKTIFWNVDTQYDFMRDDKSHKGKLPILGARLIEGNLELLTKLAKIKNIKVINTADWHNLDSEELSNNPDFVRTFPPHCLIGTKGAEFVPATSPENPYIIDWRERNLEAIRLFDSRNIVLYKDKFDVFTGTPHSNSVVELLRLDRAIVYGVATNVCVDYAVNGLLERKVQVYVPLDAIKELPNLALPYDNWSKRGVNLTTTNEIYRMFGIKK